MPMAFLIIQFYPKIQANRNLFARKLKEGTLGSAKPLFKVLTLFGKAPCVLENRPTSHA